MLAEPALEILGHGPDALEDAALRTVQTGELSDGHAGTPLTVLLEARASLEAALDEREAWRALQQLELRERAGEWLDVIEMDVLREKLTRQLAGVPEFLAWQFVDAAIGCLTAGATVPGEYDGDVEAPASDTVLQIASTGAPAPSQPAALDSDPPLARPLALRIPTLVPHSAPLADIVQVAVLTETDPASSVAVGQLTEAPALKVVEERMPEFVFSTAPVGEAEVPETQFDRHAVGIGEAEVTIVRRKTPALLLLDPRLPPTPLQERIQTSPATAPRQSRTPIAKWTDPAEGVPDDYRPVGSATDEAQVTIIATGADKVSSARAGRRAMGVAPDRETQVRKFLKTLGGE